MERKTHPPKHLFRIHMIMVLLFVAWSFVANSTLAIANDCDIAQVSNFTPDNINFKITPASIFDIDEAASTFKSHYYISYTYQVPFHISDCVLHGVNLAGVFDPKIEFMNNQKIEKLKGYNIHYKGNDNKENPMSSVRVSSKWAATFSGNFDFFNFPFDKQSFSTELMIYYPKENVQIKGHINLNKNLQVSNWRVINSNTNVSEEIWGEPYEKITFSVVMKRESLSLVTRFMVPVVVIVLIAFLALLIPKSQIESRLTVQVSSLISLTAFLIIMDTKIPELTYLTLADITVLICFIAVFLSLIITIIQYRIHIKMLE